MRNIQVKQTKLAYQRIGDMRSSPEILEIFYTTISTLKYLTSNIWTPVV